MISAASIASGISQTSTSPAGIFSRVASQPGNAEQTGALDFGDLFRGSMGNVDHLEQQARHAVEGLMRGTGVDVHEALIAAEKANAAFELTLSMRNKAIQSYQSIMSMQF
jgi:flagellar hook-basal body complex protein FliE